MTKKPKPPTPTVGDRVKLKGRNASGVLRKVDGRKWAIVQWDDDADKSSTARIVHLAELDKIE